MEENCSDIKRQETLTQYDFFPKQLKKKKLISRAFLGFIISGCECIILIFFFFNHKAVIFSENIRQLVEILSMESFCSPGLKQVK